MKRLFIALCLLLALPATAAEYKADVISIYDGDTITADIYLGLGVVLKAQKIRLYGIDAPEIRGPEKAQGMLTRAWLVAQIQGKQIILVSPPSGDKRGKYGRWLFDIRNKGGLVSEQMIEQGLAFPYMKEE